MGNVVKEGHQTGKEEPNAMKYKVGDKKRAKIGTAASKQETQGSEPKTDFKRFTSSTTAVTSTSATAGVTTQIVRLCL